MRVQVWIERVFEMDEARILAESSFDPPPSDASEDEKRRWLREAFYELCGIDREQDHVDGSYVGQVEESIDVDFIWPKAAGEGDSDDG